MSIVQHLIITTLVPIDTKPQALMPQDNPKNTALLSSPKPTADHPFTVGWVWVTQDGVLRYPSSAFLALQGFTDEDWRNSTLTDWLQMWDNRQRPPVLTQPFLTTLPKANIVAHYQPLEVPGIDFVGVVHIWSITKDNATELTSYRAILDNSLHALYLMDKDLHLIAYNKVAEHEAAQALNKELYVGMDFRTLVMDDVKEDFEKRVEKVFAGEEVLDTVRYDFPGFPYFYFEVCYKPVYNADGSLFGLTFASKNITEQEVAKQTLEEEVNMRSKVLDAMMDGFVLLNAEGQYIQANESYLRTIGYQEEELYDMHLYDFEHLRTPNEVAELLHQITDIGTLQFESRHKTAEGRFVVYDIKAVSIKQYKENGPLIAFVMRDITDQKRIELEMQKYALVTENSLSGILVIDDEGDIDYANEAVTQITGFDWSEIKDLSFKEWLQLLQPNPQRKGDSWWEAWKEGQPFQQEISLLHKNGSKLWLEVFMQPSIAFISQARLSVILLIDITERKRNERERTKLIDDLIERNKNLQEFAYVLSHNIRGPLSNIMGLTQLIESKGAHISELQDYLNKLGSATHQLDEVVKDLNVLLTARTVEPLVKTKVDLANILHRISVQLESMIKDSDASLHIHVEDAPKVFSIHSYLETILYNLISNAIKYRHLDRTPKISVSSYKNHHDIVIKVSDNGMGVDLEKHGEQIFDLYKKAHHHTTGKGVGLHLVRTMVQALDGEIKVQSAVGKGSTFILMLPQPDMPDKI